MAIREILEVPDPVLKQVSAPVTRFDDDADYPTPVRDATGKDEVLVGRVRQDISHPSGINMWIVADNVRKGAATNSVQIAELLVRDYL